MKNLRFTPAMTFVLHTAISICVGALVAGLTALGQIIFTSSDPRVIFATAGAAFCAWFVHGFVSLAQNPQTVQAGLDGLGEVKALVDQHTQAISQLQALAAQPSQVVGSINLPSATVTASVPQFQYVPTNTYPLQAVGK